MEWISIKDKKPENYADVFVCNSKGFMGYVRAIYYEKDDIFVLNDPNYVQTILLAVTHWFAIPLLPGNI